MNWWKRREWRFDLPQKLIMVSVAMIVLVPAMLAVYYGVVQRDAWEQQLHYFEKNHEQTSALLGAVEQKVGTYYHQLVGNNDLINIIAKPDYGKADYYTLSQIQRSFINITNSEPEIISIYLYSRASDKVLSTKFMFSNLDYFPDHVIINQFRSEPASWKWYPSRNERAGDQKSPAIISWAAGVPFNSKQGVIVFNLDQRKLLEGFAAKKTGIVVLDGAGQVIGYQNQPLFGVFRRHRAQLPDDAGQRTQVVRVSDSGRKYYLIAGTNPRSHWRVVSVVPESLVGEGIKTTPFYLYGIGLLVLVSTLGLARMFQKNYRESLRAVQEKVQAQLAGLAESFAVGVLTGEYSEEEIPEKAGELGLDLSSERYLVIVFQINNYYSFLLENREYQPRIQLSKGIQSAIRERFASCSAAVATVELGKVAVILPVTDDSILDKVPELIGESQRRIETDCRLTVQAAVSDTVRGVAGIQVGYAQALQALSYKSFSGKNTVVRYQEVQNQAELAPAYPVAEIACLKEYIKIGNPAKVEEAIDRICQSLMTQRYMSADLVNAIFSNVFYEITKLILEYGYSIKDIFGDEDLFIELYRCDLAEEKAAFISRICRGVMEYRNGKEQNTQKQPVQRIIDYIEANYDRTISLEIVAAEVGMNPSYLSKFINKELGIHFIDYVMELRLKKALRLLQEGDLPVKQVAELSGFDTVHSFIRNFKKRYQLTPSEFRNQPR